MNEAQYHSAVERLESALAGPDGLRPFTRIELEPLAGQIRWTIWDGDRRIYMATGGPEDIPGVLEASRMFLQMRAGINPLELPKEIKAIGSAAFDFLKLSEAEVVRDLPAEEGIRLLVISHPGWACYEWVIVSDEGTRWSNMGYGLVNAALLDGLKAAMGEGDDANG